MGATEQSFLELLEGWDGLTAVVRHDEPTGTWIFIALHDDTLGTPAGGVRMRVYPRPEDGLRDALRLSEGMTAKWASIEFPFGGGKAVLAVPEPLVGDARRGLLHRFGELLNSLHGAFVTGEDLGTTPADLQEVASVSEHVVGMPKKGEGDAIDPGPFTALGVFEGMKAALRHRSGGDDLSGRTVLIEGAGDVGEPLARMVAEAGGTVLIADIDQAKAIALAAELGGGVVTADTVYDTGCDVYAPCAVGATLNPDTIPRLRCEVVAGSANNQLESDADADRLADLGILYAPDYVINAGGAMALALIYGGESDPQVLHRRVAGIGPMLGEVFAEASELGGSPVAAARRRVARVLAKARETGVEGA